MILSPSAFRLLGWDMLRHRPINSAINRATSDSIEAREEAEFRSAFGVSSDVCSHVWEYMVTYETLEDHVKTARPTHLLWSLMFLKVYSTENFLCSLLQTTGKTFRKWVWRMASAISNLYDIVVRISCDVPTTQLSYSSLIRSLFYCLITTDQI